MSFGDKFHLFDALKNLINPAVKEKQQELIDALNAFALENDGDHTTLLAALNAFAAQNNTDITTLGSIEDDTRFNKRRDFEYDPFGRQRVSQQQTLWEIRHTVDNNDHKAIGFQATGTGGDDEFNEEHAARRLFITAGNIGRYTYAGNLHVPYQPGKGQHLKGTSIFGPMTAGKICRFGLRNRRTGERMFWEQDGDRDDYFVVLESYRGAGLERVHDLPRTTDLGQGVWDDNFTSIANFDFENNILADIDFQWLSSGRLRKGFDDGTGKPRYVFKEGHSGKIPYPFTRSPDFQVFWEIETTAALGTDVEMFGVCASVESDGGQEVIGRNFGAVSNPAGVTLVTAEVCLLAVRPMTTFKGLSNIGNAILKAVRAYAGGPMQVRVLYNPTMTGGTFLPIDNNSILEYANGVGGTSVPTITGGDAFDDFFVVGGLGSASGVSPQEVEARLQAMTLNANGTRAIGFAIMASKPLTASVNDARCSIQWVEQGL